MASQKVLALDFGTVRVGCALSYGTLADPLIILPNDESLFPALQKIIDEHGVTQLVVGISENKTAERTHAFVEKLKKKIAIPVELVDETLTTYQSRQKLLQNGLNSYQADKQKVDHFAAAELLQEWLDTQAE